MDSLKEVTRFNERARRNVAILETLRKAGPLTKAEISNMVGLNVVTVTNYINHFLENDFVVEKELDISQGGRRPVLLDLNPDASYVIGVGVNMNNLTAVLTNIDGQILSQAKRTPDKMQIRDIVATIKDLVREVLEKFEGDKSKIKGIGIGIGGIVDRQSGAIKWPERISEDEYEYVSIYVPLKEYIEREFNLPTLVENDATVAAFGEYWFYMDSSVENLIYLFSGVGCGMILGGDLYRGSSGCAGELTLYNPEQSAVAKDSCFLGRPDSDMGIVRELKKRLQIKREDITPLMTLCEGNKDKITFDLVVEAMKQGDPLVRDVVREKARCLGLKCALLVNLLNPQVVVVGGGIERLGSELIDTVREVVDSWAFHEMASVARIMPSRLGENAVALGAASLVMRNVFAQL